jgi:pimeloyl-ACP methyl ester carboxylesterase
MDLERAGKVTASWRSAGQFLEWQGLRIFHRGEGGGEPLLLLHGFPTSSWDWKDVWTGLAREHRLVTFDYGGFGFSSKPSDGPYSVFAYADQAEAVLRHHGIEAFHLLAHDLGDTVAQELLARGGGRIRSVCLLNGGIFPELHRPRPIQRLLASPLGPLVSRSIDQKRFEKSLSAVFGANTRPTREDLAGFWECASDGVRIYHRLIDYMRERRVHRGRWVAALLDEAVPLAFIDGLDDPVSGAHVVGRLRELRPGASITGLAGIGHYPQIEAPAAVLRAYRDFRASLAASTAR